MKESQARYSTRTGPLPTVTHVQPGDLRATLGATALPPVPGAPGPSAARQWSPRSSPRGGWFEGIHRLPVTPTALLGLLSPLTAALLGHLAVSEVLSPAQLLGLALALTAMTAGQLAPPSSRFSCG